MVEKRSLYQCFHAKVKGGRIYCEKGHRFESGWRGKRTLSIDGLARGVSLVFSICQGCIDYEPMGDPIPPEERGWIRYERFTTFDGTNEVANSLRLSLYRSV